MIEDNDSLENTIAISMAMVVHELQAHLQGMLAKAEILADSAKSRRLDPVSLHRELNELVDMIRITNLTLSNFATQMRAPRDDQFVDLDKVVRDTVKLCEPLARQKGLSIVYRRLTSMQPVVRGTTAQLQQALYNLLHNAIVYSHRDSKPKSVTYVEVVLSQEDSSKYLLRISNVGPTLEQNEIEQIFRPGFRGTEGARKTPSGTGFGLWVARTIARNYGGDISIESETVKPDSAFVTVTMSFPAKAQSVAP